MEEEQEYPKLRKYDQVGDKKKKLLMEVELDNPKSVKD